MKSRNIIFIALIAALALLASCATPRSADYATITVDGSGSVKLKADVVTFTVRISELADTTKAAQDLANAKIARMLSLVRSAGIADEDIKTGSLSIYTDYSWEDGAQVRLGERVSQSLTIKSRDLEGFAGLVDQIAESISGLEFNNVIFDKEDKSEAYAQAREKAIADAQSKAKAYADASGLKLYMPMTISEGGFGVVNSYNYPMALMKADMAASAESAVSTEIPSGELSVTASISITYRAVL